MKFFAFALISCLGTVACGKSSNVSSTSQATSDSVELPESLASALKRIELGELKPRPATSTEELGTTLGLQLGFELLDQLEKKDNSTSDLDSRENFIRFNGGRQVQIEKTLTRRHFIDVTPHFIDSSGQSTQIRAGTFTLEVDQKKIIQHDVYGVYEGQILKKVIFGRVEINLQNEIESIEQIKQAKGTNETPTVEVKVFDIR